ncbi:hypothetical protein O3P69_020003 [Scylla paramamosain]|uniref:Peptidase A2 domain-containing protein n=1 Tax=Scylla paramamosain TaxID=85552 RepID=A0AAW0SCU4_SCYPA
MPLPRRSPRSTPRASTTVVPRSLQPLLQQARQTISDQQQAITTLQANMAALITRGNVAPAPRVPLSAAPEKCDLDMTPAAFRSSKRPHGTASAYAVSGSVTTAGANVSRQPTIEVTVALGMGAKHRTAAVADTGAQVCVAGAALLSSLNIQPTQLQGYSSGPCPPGTRVRMQNQASGTWDRTGLIVEALPYRQYTVRLDGSGRISLRNRNHLRPVAESTPPPAPPTLRPPTPPAAQPTTTPAQVSIPTQPQLRPAPRRQVRRPGWLSDYV